MPRVFFPSEPEISTTGDEWAVGAGFDDMNPYSWIMTAAQGALNATASRGKASLGDLEKEAEEKTSKKTEPSPAPAPSAPKFKLPANFRLQRRETVLEKAKKYAPYAVMVGAVGTAAVFVVRRFRR